MSLIPAHLPSQLTLHSKRPLGTLALELPPGEPLSILIHIIEVILEPRVASNVRRHGRVHVLLIRRASGEAFLPNQLGEGDVVGRGLRKDFARFWVVREELRARKGNVSGCRPNAE